VNEEARAIGIIENLMGPALRTSRSRTWATLVLACGALACGATSPARRGRVQDPTIATLAKVENAPPKPCYRIVLDAAGNFVHPQASVRLPFLSGRFRRRELKSIRTRRAGKPERYEVQDLGGCGYDIIAFYHTHDSSLLASVVVVRDPGPITVESMAQHLKRSTASRLRKTLEERPVRLADRGLFADGRYVMVSSRYAFPEQSKIDVSKHFLFRDRNWLVHATVDCQPPDSCQAHDDEITRFVKGLIVR
jgi:hypothetical protein